MCLRNFQRVVQETSVNDRGKDTNSKIKRKKKHTVGKNESKAQKMGREEKQAG